jgi:hypothetical protein
LAIASEAEKWLASHPTDSRKKEISEWIKNLPKSLGIVTRSQE